MPSHVVLKLSSVSKVTNNRTNNFHDNTNVNNNDKAKKSNKKISPTNLLCTTSVPVITLTTMHKSHNRNIIFGPLNSNEVGNITKKEMGFGKFSSSIKTRKNDEDPKLLGFGSVFKSNTQSKIGFESKKLTTDSNTILSPFSSTTLNPNISGKNLPTLFSPKNIDSKNGEEDETCVFQIRAKLFKLTTKKKTNNYQKHLKRIDYGHIFNGDIHSSLRSNINSAPHTMNNFIVNSLIFSDRGRTEGRGIVEEKDKQPKNSQKNDNPDKVKQEKYKKINAETKISMQSNKQWTEIGIGPIRILEMKTQNNENSTFSLSVRIVQRRECTPGGQGTRVILNLLLRKKSLVFRQSDRYVRLASFEANGVCDNAHSVKRTYSIFCHGSESKDTRNKGESESNISFTPVQYLFKLMSISDANNLQHALEMGIPL